VRVPPEDRIEAPPISGPTNVLSKNPFPSICDGAKTKKGAVIYFLKIIRQKVAGTLSLMLPDVPATVGFRHPVCPQRTMSPLIIFGIKNQPIFKMLILLISPAYT
jgi:hypothetical protein